MKKYRIHFNSGKSLDIEADEVKRDGFIVSFLLEGDLIDSFFETEVRRIDIVAELPVKTPSVAAVVEPRTADEAPVLLPFSHVDPSLFGAQGSPNVSALRVVHAIAGLPRHQSDREIALLKSFFGSEDLQTDDEQGDAPQAPSPVSEVEAEEPYLLPFSHVSPALYGPQASPNVPGLRAMHHAIGLPEYQSAAEVAWLNAWWATP